MKTGILWLFLVTLLLGSAGIYSQNAWQFQVLSGKTAKHKRLPGTHVYWIPSDYFEFEPRFGWLSDKKTNTICINESNTGYARFLSHSKIFIDSYHLSVSDSAQLELNDLSGMFYEIADPNIPEGKTLLFVVGNKDKAISFLVQELKNEELFDIELTKLLSNLYIDWKHVIDPDEFATFRIDVSDSPFKYSELEAGNFRYSIGGKKVTIPDDNENTFRIQMQPSMDYLTDDMLEASTTNRLAADNIKIYYFKKTSDVKIQNYTTKEYEFYAFYESRKVIIYQVAIINGDYQVLFEALILNDLENTLKEMKRVANTIQFK